jgi:MFS transporter, FHS family, L-fucose permease
MLQGEDTVTTVEATIEGRQPAANTHGHSTRTTYVTDAELTGASALTTRQSIVPVLLVTILFFMWGFAYGLLDVLNAHFQDVLGVTASQASGLQGAYFGYEHYSDRIEI